MGYKTHYMCDEAVRIKPYLLKFVPDWFVTPKILVNLDNDKTLRPWIYEKLFEGV